MFYSKLDSAIKNIRNIYIFLSLRHWRTNKKVKNFKAKSQWKMEVQDLGQLFPLGKFAEFMAADSADSGGAER